MYGEKEKSLWPRLFLTANHAVAVLIAYWLLLANGIEIIVGKFGLSWMTGGFSRRVLLSVCSVIYFLRILLTSFFLLRRKMDWGEAVTIVIWLYFIHIAFALSGGTEHHPIGMLEVCGIVLYLAGSYLNTGSEYFRRLWKQRPENGGKLYTGGLFRYSMHINYFGDFVLFTGFALITRSLYALIIPLLMLIFFMFINIPMLDRYLESKYGGDFEEYRKRTKSFIPFVY